MAQLKIVYFLVAILHGGPNDPFSFTRLGAFPDSGACEAAAKTVNGALQDANQGASPRAEIGCISSAAIDSLKRR